MDTQKEIEISKELSTEIGYDFDKNAVVLNVKYEGKYGYNKNESGVKLIAILEKVAEGTSSKWDDMGVDALEKLIAFLKSKQS